nr:MAG TPA: hypothetical protein [Caudoviricetes sp.]
MKKADCIKTQPARCDTPYRKLIVSHLKIKIKE